MSVSLVRPLTVHWKKMHSNISRRQNAHVYMHIIPLSRMEPQGAKMTQVKCVHSMYSNFLPDKSVLWVSVRWSRDRDPLRSLCFMSDDVILISDINKQARRSQQMMSITYTLHPKWKKKRWLMKECWEEPQKCTCMFIVLVVFSMTKVWTHNWIQ